MTLSHSTVSYEKSHDFGPEQTTTEWSKDGVILIMMQPWIRRISTDTPGSLGRYSDSSNLFTALINDENHRHDIHARFESFVAPQLKNIILEKAMKKFRCSPFWLPIKFLISSARHETYLTWNEEDNEWELTTRFNLLLPFSKDFRKKMNERNVEFRQTSDETWRTPWIRCTVDESGGIEVQVPKWTKIKFPKGVARLAEHYKDILSRQFEEAGFYCEDRHHPQKVARQKECQRSDLFKTRSSFTKTNTRRKTQSRRSQTLRPRQNLSKDQTRKQTYWVRWRSSTEESNDAKMCN